MYTEKQKYWLDIQKKVAEKIHNGLTAKEACKELGVKEGSYWAWKSRFKNGLGKKNDVKVIEYKSTPKQKVAPKKIEINAAVFTAAQVHALLKEFVR